MATELLERMVIRYFDEFSVDYQVLANRAVKLVLPSKAAAGGMEVVIADQEISGAGLFAVMTRITKFTESQAPRALDMCNAVNRGAVGKFTIDEDGEVIYCLNWPVTDSAEPKDVRLMLTFLAHMVDRYYPPFMAIRWGKVTVKDALEEFIQEEISDDERHRRLVRRWLEGMGLGDGEEDS